MSPTTTLYHKGTSTILGTLIFVSIIFSAFIPMMIVMSQADTLYDMRKHELGILDQERGQEEVYVYVYPTTPTPTAPIATTLKLEILNRGNLVIEVVQIWINDEYTPVNVQIAPMGSEIITLDDEEYGFIPDAGFSYLIKINTARGNVFSPDSGSIKYIGDGLWNGGVFALNFYISYPEAGWYDIEIYEVIEGEPVIEIPVGIPFQIHKSNSGPAFAFVKVDNPGTYHVTITKNSNSIYDEKTTISLSPVMWVFA